MTKCAQHVAPNNVALKCLDRFAVYASAFMPGYYWDLVFVFSKLLQQLDKASQEDPVGIEEAVLDKGWKYIFVSDI